MLKQTPIPWVENSTLLLRRKTGNTLHFHRDPVESVTRMPPEIARQVIAHVDQLLRHHNLKRIWLREIQAFEMNQDPMRAGDWMHRIGSTHVKRHRSTKPTGEDIAPAGNPKRFTRQFQLLYILFYQLNDAMVAFLKPQASTTPRFPRTVLPWRVNSGEDPTNLSEWAPALSAVEGVFRLPPTAVMSSWQFNRQSP